ncbi:MAG: HEAT repeat domain-containing protein [Pirellulaceae bacterium]|nr:HEAT repeat domain-containing protein [Pirellulaceae bacterium]
MKLPFPFCAAALLAALLGCGGNKPAPTPAKAEPVAKTESGSSPVAAETTPDPSIAKETKPKVVQGPAEPPKQVADDLRTLAARLVEKSPQGSWRINEAAALELEKLGSDAQADLVALLGDARPEARRGAAFYLLAKFNPSDAKQVAGYTGLLDDKEPFLRSLGLQAVRKMQKADQAAAVPRLSKMLATEQEPSADNRAALARVLGSLKQDAALALEALTSGAKDDESSRVRGAFLVAISQIASPEQALPAFRQGLADPDVSVRLVAAARLRQLGIDAAPAAEDLAQALEDADASVREAAAEALVKVGPAAVEPLSQHVDSKNAPTRQLAIACLGKLGPAAKSALPLVEKHLTDEDPEVKKIAEAVVRILKAS